MSSFKPVIAVIRALDVLAAVNELKEASVSALFKKTRLNQPTIIRMLETLEHAGYVRRHPTQALYMTTGKTFELSRGYDQHRQVGIATAPILARLRRKVGWPSDVALFDHDAMVVVQTSRGVGRLFYDRRPGYRAPVFATSLGLAYVAFCSQEDRERALTSAAKSPDSWNDAARDEKQAKRLIDRIRKQRYATIDESYSRREYEGTIGTIGLPILVDGVAVAALNMIFLREAINFGTVLERCLDPLLKAAKEIADTFPVQAPATE
jgi:IclR family mhp operon transcriptional activator